MYEVNPNMEDAARVRLAESYGGEWRFNEIIGYIRLYFLGNQVRGEHQGVYKKRIVQTRTKKFEFIHWKLADEVEIPNPITDEGIFRAVLEYVDDCRKELPRHHIDTTSLLVLGKHLSWRDLFFSK